MNSRESALAGVGTVESAAARHEQVWFGAAGRRARTADGAVIAPGCLPGGAFSESLERAIDVSDVRLEEVVRVRLAIAAGSYKVSAAALADKIIAACAGSPELAQED